MKIDIKDLLDDYNDMVDLDLPDAFAARNGIPKAGKAPGFRTYRVRRTLVIAAAMLLVVTACFTVPFAFSQTSGSHALHEGSSFDERVEETASEVSIEEVPEEIQSIVETTSDASRVVPQTIVGKIDETSCYGNLLCVDGTYYTMTEDGPELLEMQNVHTTVELYGSWKVDIDYAIVDGQLVFRNATSTMPYAELNGETVYWDDFSDISVDELLELNNQLNWTKPNVAVPTPVKGSTDTVMLTIRRTDQSNVETCNYPFFYNLNTGEISDPLGEVPALFDYGNVSSIRINDACTRAIVEVYAMEQSPDGVDYAGGTSTYVCDLQTGEMKRVWDLLEPYLPVAEKAGTEFSAAGGCRWADDDTLLFWGMEAVPNGEEDAHVEGATEISDSWDRFPWLFSYNIATETLNYRQRDVDIASIYAEANETYIHDFIDNESYSFRVVDSASGAAYVLSNVSFLNIIGTSWDRTATRTILEGDDGALYLVDDTQLAWVNLSEYIELPTEEFLSVHLVTEDWVCLATDTEVYCYRIPDTMEMTSLTEK